jgi:hypothetical protein
VKIWPGGAADVQVVLALMDEAVEWLVARRQTEQWGTEPISGRGSFVAQLESWVRDGGLRIAQSEEGEPVGALIVGPHHPTFRPRTSRSST